MSLLLENMITIGKQAKQAACILGQLSTIQKNDILQKTADHIRKNTHVILQANIKDIEAGKQKGLSDAMLDRLLLTDKRLEAIAQSLEMIIQLPDPVGRILDSWDRPNGLKIERVSVPIGVIGIIYESRPNVTIDAGALALKSGNAVILRGGSESLHSNLALYQAFSDAFAMLGYIDAFVQYIQTPDRDAVGHMLADMTDYIDMIIPRGGKNLVARVQEQARVPVLAHLEGICHTYFHENANVKMAENIILNAKMRRTGVCGATETLLVDKNFPQTSLVQILQKLQAQECEIRGCKKVQSLMACVPALDADWETEYLAPILSVKIVDNLLDALKHIQKYSTLHTESIVTDNMDAANMFLKHVASAIVLHNASTQFADGGEFGMGAEIGIATGKMHARGPIGLEQLNCFQYRVHGTGQIRPL